MSITSIYAKKTGRRFKGTSRRSPRKPIEGLKNEIRVMRSHGKHGICT